MVLRNKEIANNEAAPVETIWEMVKDALSQEMTPATYNTWIKRLRTTVVAGNTIHLEAPNHFFRSYIEKTYGLEICRAVAQISRNLGLPEDSFPIVSFGESTPSALPDLGAEPAPEPLGPSSGGGLVWASSLEASRAQSGKGLILNPKLNFESFVVGDPNRLAYNAAKSFALDSTLLADILFIIGDPGLGKSHLVQALAQSYMLARQHASVRYLTFEEFTNELVYNINHRTMEDFKSKYRENCDLLVLEEASFLKEKLKIQEELCYTLDNIINNGKKIVITSTKPLQSIPKMDQSLKSRLSSSLMANIGPPDYETRLAILMKLSQNYKQKFSRPVLEYIAKNIRTDVRQLQSCLYTMNANQALLGRPVNMAMAEETVQHVSGDESQLILAKVVKAVCCAYNISEEQLRSGSRRKVFSEARSLGMYLAKNMTGHTLAEIGAAFGRNHSTASYSIEKISLAMSADKGIRLKVEHLIRELDKSQRKAS